MMPSAPPDLSLTPFLVVGVIALVAGAAVWWQRRRTGARPDDVERAVRTTLVGAGEEATGWSFAARMGYHVVAPQRTEEA